MQPKFTGYYDQNLARVSVIGGSWWQPARRQFGESRLPQAGISLSESISAFTKPVGSGLSLRRGQHTSYRNQTQA
jgi:hypothetical protein